MSLKGSQTRSLKIKKENLLTIVLPTCDDYSGVMMTVMHLIMDRRFETLDYDILVVDNTPSETERKHLLNNLPMDSGRVSYMEIPESLGPAHTKDSGIQAAQGKFVLCMDCHVLLHDSALTKLYDFLTNLSDSDSTSDDIFSGPLLYKGSYKTMISTHFQDIWRGHMWGTWGTDLSLLEDDTPKEIKGQGCGLFLVKRSSWLGFCKEFSGFGGEEMLIHEKYRKNGRKAMLLPWLGWWHRFGYKKAQQPVNHTILRVRNYVVGFLELDMDLKPVYDHFVNTDIPSKDLKNTLVKEFSFEADELKDKSENDLRGMLASKKISQESWLKITSDPEGTKDIHRRKAKPAKPNTEVTKRDDLPELSQELMRLHKSKSPAAKELGFIATMVKETESKKVAEITYISETGIALAVDPSVENVNSHYYFDSSPNPLFLNNQRVSDKTLKTSATSNLHFQEAIDSFMSGDDVDLLLLKLPPVIEGSTEDVLNKLAEKTKKGILVHDTLSEDFANHTNGLKLFSHKSNWKTKYIMSKVYDPKTKEQFNTDGIALLSKNIDVEDMQFAWPWVKQGAGTELKKMLAKLNFKVSEDCKCNRHARIMDELGVVWCENNIDLICGWLMEESEKKGWGATIAAKLAAPKLVKRAIKIHKKKILKQGEDK